MPIEVRIDPGGRDAELRTALDDACQLAAAYAIPDPAPAESQEHPCLRHRVVPLDRPRPRQRSSPGQVGLELATTLAQGRGVLL